MQNSFFQKLTKSFAALAMVFGLIGVTEFKIQYVHFFQILLIVIIAVMYWHFFEQVILKVRQIKQFFYSIDTNIKTILEKLK